MSRSLVSAGLISLATSQAMAAASAVSQGGNSQVVVANQEGDVQIAVIAAFQTLAALGIHSLLNNRCYRLRAQAIRQGGVAAERVLRVLQLGIGVVVAKESIAFFMGNVNLFRDALSAYTDSVLAKPVPGI